MRVAYTILDFNSTTKTCVIRVKDVLGNKHDLSVPAEGLMNHELGNGFVQDNFPDLTAAERELLITGIPESLWDKTFGDE